MTGLSLETSNSPGVSRQIYLGLLHPKNQSSLDGGQDVNRLISTVFRNGLSVLSIALAAVVLAALLLMSGNPNQVEQQRVDAEMRYLGELDDVLAQTLDATWDGSVKRKPRCLILRWAMNSS